MKLSYSDTLAIEKDISSDNVAAIRARVESGLDPTKALSDYYEQSVFQLAALAGAVNVVRYLIEAGFNVNKGVRKWTPLMEASGQGHVEIVGALLDARADPNLKSGVDEDDGDRQLTALMLAAEGRHLEVIQMLLDAGADPTALTNKGRSAINFVTSGDPEGRKELVQRLLDLGCPVVGACLIRPIYEADADMVKFLLDHGADPNQPSTKQEQVANGPGVRPIHSTLIQLAMERMLGGDRPEKRMPYLEILTALIDAGADLNMESAGTWAILKHRVADDPELLDVLRQAGWQGTEEPARAAETHAARHSAMWQMAEEAVDPDMLDMLRSVGWENPEDGGLPPQKVIDALGAPPEEAEPQNDEPLAKQRKNPTKGTLIGARDFVETVFDFQPEWSLFAVEAPIESVADAFVCFRNARGWMRNVAVSRETRNTGFPADEIPVVQMANSHWTVVIRSLFDLTGVEIEQVPEEAKHLSEQLETRAITFMGEDTSGAMGYELFDRGALIEKATWGCGADVFESSRRDKPAWPEDEFDIADLVFSELGIYVPFCYAEADGEQPRLVANKKIVKHIARADLINL